MKYTELELKVIESIDCFLNYGDLESDLDDNATGERQIRFIIGLCRMYRAEKMIVESTKCHRQN